MIDKEDERQPLTNVILGTRITGILGTRITGIRGPHSFEEDGVIFISYISYQLNNEFVSQD